MIVDLFLHLDRHLVDMLARFHEWIYAILFVIIFAETGLVVVPFLPGDSLLFGVGALAAVAGNTLNYAIGRQLGQRAFSGRYRFFKLSYLQRTEAYFRRHGGLAVLLSRFMPIVRTFTPFVAGIGRMHYARFQAFNLAGGVSWVALFLFGGFAFGNLPWVQTHFSVVTLLVIAISVLPLVVVAARDGLAIERSSG